MPKTTTVFEQRWSLWLSTLSGTALIVSWKQRSWRTTLNKTRLITQQAKENGETVNLIYSKGWFKHSDQMKALTYDRLVYYDIDTRRYSIKTGIGRESFTRHNLEIF